MKNNTVEKLKTFVKKQLYKTPGLVLGSLYAVFIISVSFAAANNLSDLNADFSDEQGVENGVIESRETNLDKNDKDIKRNEKGSTSKKNSKNSNSNSKHSNSSDSNSKHPGSSNSGSSSSSSKKVWVEPVYKYVDHPAETRTRKVLVGVTCACGAFFNSTGEWQAHRPVPCDGNHTYYESHYENQTVVVKDAWTEKVLVKEGYWKEG